jgi:hypothetical protein
MQSEVKNGSIVAIRGRVDTRTRTRAQLIHSRVVQVV